MTENYHWVTKMSECRTVIGINRLESDGGASTFQLRHNGGRSSCLCAAALYNEYEAAELTSCTSGL